MKRLVRSGNRCRPRPAKKLFTRPVAEFIADFLALHGDRQEVRENILLSRFRALLESVGVKADRGDDRSSEIAQLETLPALVYAEMKRVEAAIRDSGAKK